MVILAHEDPDSLFDLVKNTSAFCSRSRLMLYNSGTDPDLGKGLDLEILPVSRRQFYAKITPFFFDVFEWLVENDASYDYVINLETDMLFIRHGYEDWVSSAMSGYDYMAPNLVRFVSPKSRWRPYKSLRPELSDWFEFVGFRHVHGAFSPGQVFSHRYVEAMVKHRHYSDLKRLIAANKSHTLQEILFPTLPDTLGLETRSYPVELKPFIRYRPYQAVSGIKRALGTPQAYFVHPVRRSLDDPARTLVRSLQESS